MNSAVVDFLSLRDMDNKFVVKELAININGSTGHWMFRKPFSMKLDNKSWKLNKWVTDRYHGIELYDGEVPYEMLKPIVKKYLADVDNIFTKGLEKCTFLEDIVEKPVFDLNVYNCPKHFNKQQKCLFHVNVGNENFECALQNCNSNYDWAYLNVNNF